MRCFAKEATGSLVCLCFGAKNLTSKHLFLLIPKVQCMKNKAKRSEEKRKEQIDLSLISMCQTGSLFTCTMFTRRPGIPFQYNKRWTCACVRELCALHALPESTPHRSILEFRRRQALFGALPSAFSRLPSLGWAVWSAEKQPQREREREKP